MKYNGYREKFLEKAYEKYGFKYDYSKVVYEGTRNKVCIICPDHGEFYVTPDDFLHRNCICPVCSGRKVTEKMWLQRAKEKHNGFYSYEHSKFVNTATKVAITCPIHGDFYQTPKNHLQGNGCPECKKTKCGKTRRLSVSDFVKKAKKVHNEKYDYSLVDYKKNNLNVKIICPVHGVFFQKPNNHLAGQGCPKCSKVYRPTGSEWISRAKSVHGDRYDYSKTTYKNAKTKVCIICSKHGEFWQLPYAHISNQAGCPLCDMSHMEEKIYNLLKDNNIPFEQEVNINGYLGRRKVDFYLKEKNLVIECQGGQHFYPGFDRSNPKRGRQIHLNQKNRDIIKNELLKEKKINILYFTDITDLPKDIFWNKKYHKIYNRENFFTDTEKLLQAISSKNLAV